MGSVRLLAYGSTIAVGTLTIGCFVHFFRCSSIDRFSYSEESSFNYYCPFISEVEAKQGIYEINKNESSKKNGNNQDLSASTMASSTEPTPTDSHLRLGKHDVYPDTITLSGFSSGGTMAQHMLISHSSLFSGIASFSHAYYRCGPGNKKEADYDNACTIIGTNTTYNVDNALNDIRSYEQRRLIDSTENLRNKKLYVYAGSRSQFFSLDQSLGVVSIFEPFIKNPNNIKTRVQSATQLLPSDRFGDSCNMPADRNFFIGNCGFSGATEALQFLLGENRIRSPTQYSRPKLRQLLTFDQTEFFYGYSGPEYMDEKGFIYVPLQCHRQKCYLHFYFHGCLTGREFNGTDHIVNSGFLEVAEMNNIIVVFPQSWSSLPENNIGCWDTYGLTGKFYATKFGSQVSVIKNMVSRILGLDNDILPKSNSKTSREKEQSNQANFQIVKGRRVYLK